MISWWILTGKHVTGSLGGAAATIAVPNAMRLRGWGDVMGSGADLLKKIPMI